MKEDEVRAEAVQVWLKVDLPTLRKRSVEKLEHLDFTLSQRLPKTCKLSP
jgi:hypothetical protein